jgi:hypothetical protein
VSILGITKKEKKNKQKEKPQTFHDVLLFPRSFSFFSLTPSTASSPYSHCRLPLPFSALPFLRAAEFWRILNRLFLFFPKFLVLLSPAASFSL